MSDKAPDWRNLINYEPFTDSIPDPAAEAENFRAIIPRYERGEYGMIPASVGEWVRWADVKDLLK